MQSRTYTAPSNSGAAVMGRTLPELLYEAEARYPNPRAFNQPTSEGWRTYSTTAFRQQSEEMALGLLSLGLERGDKVAFFLETDVYFALADMGTLTAGLVNVPIYLSQAEDLVRYVIEHSESKLLFVTNTELLEKVAPVLKDLPAVQHVVVAEPEGGAPELPEHVTLMSLDELCARGRDDASPDRVKELLGQISPHDLATIIYTSGTTGTPKGVMLTHENISFNGLTAFSGLKNYEPGADGEVSLVFLPMTHIFARALHYGNVAYGSATYFCKPNELGEVVKEVRPTVFATVPRLLEKVYARIMEKASSLTGLKKVLFDWSMHLASRYELGREPQGLYKLQLMLADLLIFKKWREALGGRVKYVIVGGAALDADLANTFAAAGIVTLQGYGLTETSPVITYNRPYANRAGTVGPPMVEVEVAIADDGEVLTRGPHVMIGYYKNEEGTREVIDDDGWFHTGDIGEFTSEGFLRITDRKKNLFKLSTGKYVTPQPVENRLGAEPLVEQAIVVGMGHKFCTALIFPNHEALQALAQKEELKGDVKTLCQHPTVRARYQELVDKANEGMDHWSQIKRFTLVPAELSIESGMLTPTLKIKRRNVRERFGEEIKALYSDAAEPTPVAAH